MQLIDTSYLPVYDNQRKVILTFTTTFVGQQPGFTIDFIDSSTRGPTLNGDIAKTLGHHHWQIEEIYLEVVYHPEVHDGERSMIPVTNLEVTVTEFDPPEPKVELTKKEYYVGIGGYSDWAGE